MLCDINMLSIFKSFSMLKMKFNLSIPKYIFHVAIFNEFIALGLDMAYDITKMTYGNKRRDFTFRDGRSTNGSFKGYLVLQFVLGLGTSLLRSLLVNNDLACRK